MRGVISLVCFTQRVADNGILGYAQSKVSCAVFMIHCSQSLLALQTANILFAQELNRRYSKLGINAYAVHPVCCTALRVVDAVLCSKSQGVIPGTSLGRNNDIKDAIANGWMDAVRLLFVRPDLTVLFRVRRTASG